MTHHSTIFIDFPNGTYEAIAQKYEDLSRCIAYADNLQKMSGIPGLRVSVWFAGKCYHSTDRSVQFTGFPD